MLNAETLSIFFHTCFLQNNIFCSELLIHSANSYNETSLRAPHFTDRETEALLLSRGATAKSGLPPTLKRTPRLSSPARFAGGPAPRVTWCIKPSRSPELNRRCPLSQRRQDLRPLKFPLTQMSQRTRGTCHRRSPLPQQQVIQNFTYRLKHEKQIKNTAEFMRRFCVRAVQSSVKLLKANEGECKCFVLKVLKFTLKTTNTELI